MIVELVESLYCVIESPLMAAVSGAASGDCFHNLLQYVAGFAAKLLSKGRCCVPTGHCPPPWKSSIRWPIRTQWDEGRGGL